MPTLKELMAYRCNLFTTWIFFYAGLNDLCAEVALRQPIDRIFVEMVFFRLYFFKRARLQKPQLQLIPCLVENHHSMVLLKAIRQ